MGCGRSPLQAETGRNPYPATLGQITVGAFADLIIADGDPTKNLDFISNPEENRFDDKAKEILKEVHTEKKTEGRTYTNGHYRRGVE